MHRRLTVLNIVAVATEHSPSINVWRRAAAARSRNLVLRVANVYDIWRDDSANVIVVRRFADDLKVPRDASSRGVCLAVVAALDTAVEGLHIAFVVPDGGSLGTAIFTDLNAVLGVADGKDSAPVCGAEWGGSCCGEGNCSEQDGDDADLGMHEDELGLVE